MHSPALKAAAPTATKPSKDNESTEGRADPHGVWWTRGAPPIDCEVFGTVEVPVDLVAQSVARNSDSSGAGTGTGRRASGFLITDATGGTIVFTTGAGNSGSMVLGAGVGMSIEMTELTSYTGTALVVFW
jgi:hypothetical protein